MKTIETEVSEVASKTLTSMEATNLGSNKELSSSVVAVTKEQLLRAYVEYLDALEDVSKKQSFEDAFASWISQIVGCTTDVGRKYNVLFLYAGRILSRSDADRIYTALSKVGKTTKKPVLLILH